MDEEDRLIQQGRAMQADNRDALANSIRVAREATQMGTETLNKLESQREQFQRMDTTLDSTADSLTRSERMIRGMKSWGGSLANAFSSNKSKKQQNTFKPSPDSNSSTTTASATQQQSKAISASANSSSTQSNLNSNKSAYASSGHTKQSNAPSSDLGSLEHSLTNAQSFDHSRAAQHTDKTQAALTEFDAAQRLEDNQLDELSDILSHMKMQATDLNKELKTHDQLIQHIGTKLDTTGVRVKEANRNIKKIT